MYCGICLYHTLLVSFGPYLAYACLFCRWGSHNELAYSTVGLSKAVYAYSWISLFDIYKFCLKNPIVLFAFDRCYLYGHHILGQMLWWLPYIWLMKYALSCGHGGCKCFVSVPSFWWLAELHIYWDGTALPIFFVASLTISSCSMLLSDETVRYAMV